jgi:hypothetical protein
LLVLLFDPKDVGDMFPRKLGLSEIHGIATQKNVMFVVTTQNLNSKGSRTSDSEVGK